MSALLESLSALLAPWSDLYSSSSPLETVVVFLHIGGVVAGGGLAFTLDRAVFRSARHGWPGRGDLARDLHESHLAVLLGLGVVLLSGVALTAADAAVFLASWIYWAKMGIVVLLLANGWLLKRAGEALLAAPEDKEAFGRLRASALRSAGLWALAVLGGVAITIYS